MNSFGPLPFKEALAFWRSKVPMSAKEFYGLADEQRTNAFTVSGLMDLDQIKEVYRSFEKVLAEGMSFGQWKSGLAHIWEDRGWTGKKAWRLDNVFRTNAQTAYAVGRHEQMMGSAAARPYWRYIATQDSRTRPTHMGMHGLVFHYKNGFWETHYPPNGYRCRCTVQTLSKRQVEKLGYEIQDETPDMVKYKDPETGAYQEVRLYPDKGFETNPATDHYKPDLSKYPARFRQAFLERLIKHNPDGLAAAAWLKRLKKYVQEDDLADMQTLLAAKAGAGIKGYKSWVEEALGKGRESGEIHAVGNLPSKVLRALEKQPRMALTVIDDTAVLHMAREAKTARGAALTAEEIGAIPEQFKSADWYVDTQDPAVLMTWVRTGTLWAKVVIRLDRQVGKGLANQIVSGGVVLEKNITRDPRYKKI